MENLNGFEAFLFFIVITAFLFGLTIIIANVTAFVPRNKTD